MNFVKKKKNDNNNKKKGQYKNVKKVASVTYVTDFCVDD